MTRKTFSILIVFLLFSFANLAKADEVRVGASVGINHAQGQLLALSYNWYLPENYNPSGLFFLEGVGAFYTEPNTAIGSIGLGAQQDFLDRLYLRGVMGASLQSRETDRLGGNFQFLLKAGAGVKYGNFRFGPIYTHYSSAGIHNPNDGDDYVGMEVGWDLR